MPDYDWTTDEVVLERLKKSPVRVEWEDSCGILGPIFDSDLQPCRAVVYDSLEMEDFRRYAIDSDADHIAMAWMVELAKKCYEVSGWSPQIWWNEGGDMIVYAFDAEHSCEAFEGPDPIHVIAEALNWYDWLAGRGEKT